MKKIVYNYKTSFQNFWNTLIVCTFHQCFQHNWESSIFRKNLERYYQMTPNKIVRHLCLSYVHITDKCQRILSFILTIRKHI